MNLENCYDTANKRVNWENLMKQNDSFMVQNIVFKENRDKIVALANKYNFKWMTPLTAVQLSAVKIKKEELVIVV